jgi:integrase
LELPRFEELLAQFPPNLKPYITFLYFCGGRSGEAELIEWSQVDLERKLIRIEDDQTKDKEAREIPLPQRLVLMLERIEPKQGRVSTQPTSARNGQRLVLRWVWAVSSQWNAGRTIRGMKV